MTHFTGLLAIHQIYYITLTKMELIKFDVSNTTYYV